MAPIVFPNETAEYRAARDRLLAAEIELRANIERVAAMRRALPLNGPVAENYVFDELDGDGKLRRVAMSELFGATRDTLFVYGFMYGPNQNRPCPMCTSFLDALNGQARHITERISLAVVARSPIERIMQFAKPRGWSRLRMLSSAHNSYQSDYLAEDADGKQQPMANVFVRRDGVIHHFWGTEMLYADVGGQPRHMDLMWPLWNVLDTTPGGRGTDWYPRIET